MSILETLGTILSVVSSGVTLEEAGRSIFKDHLKKPNEFCFSNYVVEDSELQYQLNKLLSELKDDARNCISPTEIEQIKEEYFTQCSIKVINRNDLSKVLDEFFENLNRFLEQELSVGDKLIYGEVSRQGEKQKEISSTMDRVEDELNEIKNILLNNEIANSTKDFVNRYCEELFWDQNEAKVRLCDVYIEPKTEQGTMVLDEVEAFLKNSRETVLIIEAVAGSGKSSLMAKMATLYGDKTHYFIKLSELSRKDDIGLIDELTEYSKRDSAWSEFYQQGNVLFLDGFDEIASKLNYANLQKDIRSLQQKKIKLIITTRPNYINNLNSIPYQKIVMDVYDKELIKEWIQRYAYVKKLNSEQYNSYLQVLGDAEKFSIVQDVMSIPIFLYIIVNKQVNIIEIESQTQLFECVFEQLVDDKIDREQ